MRHALILVAFLLACCAPHKAAAWIHGHEFCPYGSAYDDGCQGADRSASYQNASFGTDAIQSGQNSILSTHPQPFNVAGWDYPVGYNTNLTLKDPATYNWTGTGCVYQATTATSVLPFGGPSVFCNNNGNRDITIEGFDFSAIGGHACVALVFWNFNDGGKHFVRNNKFVIDSSCSSAAAGQPAVLDADASELYIANNEFDGGFTVSGNFATMIKDNRVGGPTDTIDVRYNYFHNLGGRPIGGGHAGPSLRVFNYNMINGMVLAGSGVIHGEVFLYVNGPTSTIDEEEQFNTLLEPQTSIKLDITAWISSNQTGGATFTRWFVNGNTWVSNQSLGQASTGTGLFQTNRGDLITTLTLTNNYGDPSGSFSCGKNISSPNTTITTLVSSGNVNLKDGSAITYFKPAINTSPAACAGANTIP